MFQERYKDWTCGDRPHRRHFSGRHRFFGGFRGGFMGGPAMRAAKMLASGDLQLVILALLSEKPRHGYEIIKAIRRALERHLYAESRDGLPRAYVSRGNGLRGF